LINLVSELPAFSCALTSVRLQLPRQPFKAFLLDPRYPFWQRMYILFPPDFRRPVNPPYVHILRPRFPVSFLCPLMCLRSITPKRVSFTSLFFARLAPIALPPLLPIKSYLLRVSFSSSRGPNPSFEKQHFFSSTFPPFSS